MQLAVRERLGKAVRDEWIAWAREQEDPKASWLVPWEELPEQDKEADRRIAEAAVTTLFEMLIPVFTNALFTPQEVKTFLQNTVIE